MVQVFVIADDLTGLLDSTAVFASRGLRTLIARTPQQLAGCPVRDVDVIGVCTSSRHLSPKQAADIVCRAIETAPGPVPPILFKKIDSRMKGNVIAETQALIARTGRSRLLICPAIPHLGRFTRDEMVIGTGVAAPLPIQTTDIGGSTEVAVPDALSQDMLDAAAADTLAEPSRSLLIGAQGLAESVAAFLRPHGRAEQISHLSSPFLMAMGSRDPISCAQASHLQQTGGVTMITAPNGQVSMPVSPDKAYPLMVQMTAGAEPLDPADAAQSFAATIAGLTRADGIRTLFACGGDTADAILADLGIGLMEVRGELAPGIAVARALGKDGLNIVTKSGGFGGATALSVLVDAANWAMTRQEGFHDVRQ